MWKSNSDLGYAIEQTQEWRQPRVDGVGRPKFDSTQVTPEQLRHLESQKDGVHVLDLKTNATAFLELSALVAAAELDSRPRSVAGGDAREKEPSATATSST